MRDLTRADVMLAGYGAACLLLGGASSAGAIANGALQLAAIAILAYVALTPPLAGAVRPGRGFRIILCGLVGLAVIQLMPMPPMLWASLPGRSSFLAAYRLLGVPAPWLPLSLAPDRAVGSLLALLPFLATLYLALRSTAKGRVAFVWAMIGVSMISIGVGSMQLFSGGTSPLYFYTITNRADAVGFFANKNHLATLFLVTLPFVAALAARDELPERKHRWERRPLYIGCFAFIMFGAVLNNSSAGLALLVPCIGACVFIYRRGIGRPLSGYVAIGAAAVAAAGLLYVSVGPYHGRFLDKAISTNNSATRGTSIALTVKAAHDFFPVGSGLGSFRHIYTGYENLTTLNHEYVNHAHNDWAEIALETGLMGLALLAAFCVWLAGRGWTLWKGDSRPGSLARAGLTSLVLILLHSLVDYPARTAAILCIAGMAIGVLAVPRPVTRAGMVPAEDGEETPASRVFVAD